MADPLGVGPPPPSAATKPKAPSYSTRPGAPIGIPSTQTIAPDGTVTYAANYTPPLWIEGQGAATASQIGVAGGLAAGLSGRAATNAPTGEAPNQGQFYVEGDEYAPGGTPDAVPQIKAQMIQAGLLDPAKQSSGAFWGQAEADAYTTVLTYANRYGVSAPKMLAHLAQNPAAPQIQLSNILDIDSLARQVIAPLIGHDLTPAQMTQFVNDYHKWETANAQNAQPQAGETNVQAADPRSFATEYAHEQFGGQEQGQNLLLAFKHIDALMKGGG